MLQVNYKASCRISGDHLDLHMQHVLEIRTPFWLAQVLGKALDYCAPACHLANYLKLFHHIAKCQNSVLML